MDDIKIIACGVTGEWVLVETYNSQKPEMVNDGNRFYIDYTNPAEEYDNRLFMSITTAEAFCRSMMKVLGIKEQEAEND